MIGTGGYLLASALVLVYVLLTGWAAERIRNAAGLEGGPATALLAWVVIVIALSTALGLLLGALGIFGRWQLIAGAAVIFIAAELIWRRSGRRVQPLSIDRIEFDRWAMAGFALVLAGWIAGTKVGWNAALVGFDTLTYHMPFALSFAFEDGLRNYTFVDVSYLHHFYPAGSELLHAIGLALVGRDLLSDFLNLGFAMISMLSAWCLGARLGSARIGMLAITPVMVSMIMLRQQAGTASSDVGAVALVLAAFALAAMALDRDSRPSGGSSSAWLGLAGVAAGLAIGIKLTAGAPMAVLSLWVLITAWRNGSARRGAILFFAGLILIGLPWELRNLLLAGNPLPFIHGIGPIDLPSPERRFEGRSPFSVAHYIVNPSGIALTDYFLPAMQNVLGWGWPLILLLAACGSLWAVLRGGSRDRAIGLAALIGALVYLVTPFSAAGPDGFPVGFEWNLRYLSPALMLGLVLSAGWASRLDPERRLSRWLPGLLLALAVATTATSNVLFVWKTLDAAWIAAVIVLFAGSIYLIRRYPGRVTPIVVSAFAVAAFGIGLADRARYLERPTGETPSYYLGDLHLQAEAGRMDGTRIGFTGQLAALAQYRLRGADFGTEVSYIGVEEPNGGFRAVRSCRELEQVIRDQGIEVVIATPDRKSNSSLRYVVYSRVASSRPIDRARFLEKYDSYGLVNYYRVLPDRRGCSPPAD